MNKQPESRNLIAAVLLSVLVLVVWQYFVEAPRIEAQRQRLAAERAQQSETAPTPALPGVPALPGAPVATPVAGPQPRDVALTSSGARLRFDNDMIDGSIRLTGAQIDNLRLKQYRETIDPKSPEIVLLTPPGTTGATFAQIGWTIAGSAMPVPSDSTVWTASGNTLTPSSPVTLTWDNGQGLVFKRRISLDANYMFTIADTVENNSGAAVTLYPYAMISREGEPAAPSVWLQHEGPFGELDGLKEMTYSELRDLEAKEKKFDSTGGWIGITDKYWMATLAPPQREKITARFSLSKRGGVETFRSDYLLGPRNIAPGTTASVSHHLFAGAKVVSLLQQYRESLGIARFDGAVDWGWFSPISYPIFVVLDWLNKQVGNFGVAIILLTILVKVLFFPVANRSYESMTKMKKIQPQIKEINERHKEDAQKRQQETMALFQREKVNPMLGCLPILIQMPVFFALYKVLFVAIEMRHAPFFGWIQDLAAGDPTSLVNLFGLLPFAVPAYLQIGVWPLLMGVTMWFQTKMNPPAADPVQQQMMTMMPLVFTYMMAQFPAGLVIYWTVNNVLSIAQQYLIMRRMNVEIELGKNMKAPAWLSKMLTRRNDKPPALGE